MSMSAKCSTQLNLSELWYTWGISSTIIIFTSDAHPIGVKHKEIIMATQWDFGSVIFFIKYPLEFFVVANPVKKYIQSLELAYLGTLAPTLRIPKIH